MKSEREIADLLAIRYPAPEWAFMRQVANGTGANFGRTMDAIAMNLYPSRGLALHGFEIKVSRNDWLRELKKPDKAEGSFKHFDYWWIVVPDRKLVKDDELPATWGLMVADAKVKVVKQAPALKETGPVSREFLASILRRASAPSIGDLQLKEAYHDGERAGRQTNTALTDARFEALLKAVKDFESASGIQIAQGWNLGRVGAAVRALRETPAEVIRQLHQTKSSAEALARNIAVGLSEVEQIGK